MKNALREESGLNRGRPGPSMDIPPARALGQCGPLPPFPHAIRACLCRCLVLMGTCGSQACAMPEGGKSSDYCRLTGRIACLRRYGPARKLCARTRRAQAATRAPPHPPHSPSWCRPWPRSSSRCRKPTCSGQPPKASKSGQLTRPPRRGPSSCRPKCNMTPRRQARPLRRSGHRAPR